MANKDKKNRGKSITNFALVIVAMGVILYFTKPKIDTLLFNWIVFCVGILVLYFIIIEIKKALTK